ncbi:MAG: helix-turn-helix transcriptional regulator [Candidatus Limnocylindrales bacterium]
MTNTGIERAALRSADRVRRALGADVERLRSDAGLSCAELSRGAGIDDRHAARIEHGTAHASLESYARLAAALGADLSVRLYPNTGPAIRDRHQARIVEGLLAMLHPPWRAYPEVAVRRPSRGWIDVGLHDRAAGSFVATEVQSELRRLEQLIRWSGEKAASLGSWEGWPRLGDAPSVSQLLIVRYTRTTREIARDFRRTLNAAYPAHPDDALAALMGTDPWPGSALLWSVPSGEAAGGGRIVATGGRIVARR